MNVKKHGKELIINFFFNENLFSETIDLTIDKGIKVIIIESISFHAFEGNNRKIAQLNSIKVLEDHPKYLVSKKSWKSKESNELVKKVFLTVTSSKTKGWIFQWIKSNSRKNTKNGIYL